MIVVADTSVLCYLILIGEIEILTQLFGQIFVPEAVANELSADGAPQTVRSRFTQPSPWLTIQAVTSMCDAKLLTLHLGEREAILLAEEMKADLILLDEKAARKIARERGLNITGLIGILKNAANNNLLDLPAAIENLRKTCFRVSPRLLKFLLD